MYCGVPAMIAGLGQAGVVGCSCEPEIGQLHSLDAVGKQDVGRLDVAVNESLGMSGGQTGRGLHSDSQDFDERERSVLIEPVLQRRPAHVRHDEIGQPLHIRHAVNFHDVVMNHRGGRLCLTREALPCGSAAAEMGRQHLDRDVPIERGIKRFEHDAHSARSDHSHDFIRAQTAEHAIVVRGGEELEHRGVAKRRLAACG